MIDEILYLGLQTLNKENSINILNTNNVYIIPFIITHTNAYPYLSFGLIKTEKEIKEITTQEFNFITYSNSKNIKTLSPCYVQMDLYNILKEINEKIEVEQIEYIGYHTDNENNVYIYMDMTHLENFELNYVSSQCNFLFVLVDEIANTQMSLNIPISENIVDYFMQFPRFLFLYTNIPIKQHKEKEDEEKKEKEHYDIIKIPSVVYCNSTETYAYFNYIFGNTIKKNEEYYKFLTYNDAIKNKTTKNSYLIRYAIFEEDIKKNNDTNEVFFNVKEYNNQHSLTYHFIH
jgi:hypothetical protein